MRTLGKHMFSIVLYEFEVRSEPDPRMKRTSNSAH
jgi:hypothetical protein